MVVQVGEVGCFEKEASILRFDLTLSFTPAKRGASPHAFLEASVSYSIGSMAILL